MSLSAVACHPVARAPNVDQERLGAVTRTAMTRCVELLDMRAEDTVVTVEALVEGDS
jgi:hypothetical protein